MEWSKNIPLKLHIFSHFASPQHLAAELGFDAVQISPAQKSKHGSLMTGEVGLKTMVVTQNLQM
jgi:hypothetical protein